MPKILAQNEREAIVRSRNKVDDMQKVLAKIL